MVRSGFGGGSNTYNFVVSGCEDSQVCIWHKLKGPLLRSSQQQVAKTGLL